MDVYEIGFLQIFISPRGINKDTLGTEYKKGKLEFTKKAVKAYNIEKSKRATLIVPITNVAFKANGASESTFVNWIKTLVWDTIRSTKEENYAVDAYNVLKNKILI